MKKMKGITFTLDMVQAILDDRKTMTRRPIKDLPEQASFIGMMNKDGKLHAAFRGRHEMAAGFLAPCKYQAGDLLYVKESWRVGAWNEKQQAIAVDYKADSFIRKEWIHIPDKNRFDRYVSQSIYQAQLKGIDRDANGEYHWQAGKAPTYWRPARYMPKKVARTFIRCTDVRVERVQDITAEDAVNEGIELQWSETMPKPSYMSHAYSEKVVKPAFVRAYYDLWDDIYADKPEYQIKANPWVYVYEFRKGEA